MVSFSVRGSFTGDICFWMFGYFDRQKITPQQMLTNELLVFVFGLILTIIVLVLSLVMAFKKRWRQSVLGLVSVLAYLVLFTASAHNGVALLYAT